MSSNLENILIKIPEIGKDMHELMVELFPICRSITGNGVRESLKILKKHIQLNKLQSLLKLKILLRSKKFSKIHFFLQSP